MSTAHRAGGVERNGVGDEFVLAVDLVQHEPACGLAVSHHLPHRLLGIAHPHLGGCFDAILLRRGELDGVRHEAARLGKQLLLCRFGRHVLHRIGGADRDGRGDQGGDDQPGGSVGHGRVPQKL
ncbi:MAG: hypothetical protein B7Y21_06265 [Hydrogenophilales bacterium 16-61-112]|nr:MAG: hypothetical protein B7Y21_06265 [Hydrogenophilales bacterium 16-61-112]